MATEDGRVISAINPRTGQADFQFTTPTDAELVALCTRLRKAQQSWGAAPLDHRIDVMQAWADQLEAHKDAISEADSIDTGYAKMSRMSPNIAISSIRGWCKQAPSILKRAQPSGVASIMPTLSFETHLRPYPLLGVISSWNAPLMLSSIDAIPALIAGCAAIIKPSSITPRFVGPTMETIRAIPELADVLSYILGDGQTGQRMTELVDIICFTGSVENGRKVGEILFQELHPGLP